MMGYRYPEWVSPWEYCKLQDKAYGIACDLWDFDARAQAQGAVLDSPQGHVDEGERAALQSASAYLLVGGQVDVEAVLTHVLPIEQAQRGMELARTKAEGAIKVILSFER